MKSAAQPRGDIFPDPPNPEGKPPKPSAARGQRDKRLRVWAEAVIDAEGTDVDRGHDGRANISQRVAVEAAEDVLALIETHEKMVPIVAALAIYGEGASLPALIEKARALNEAHRG